MADAIGQAGYGSYALQGTTRLPESTPKSQTSDTKHLSSQANEFEAMLLTQWLQSTESTFGNAPGEDDGPGAGDDQIKSFALQQLASGIAAKGGIGIARYVSQALEANKPQGSQASQPSSPGAAGTPHSLTNTPGMQDVR